jgi:hypothetical protein
MPNVSPSTTGATPRRSATSSAATRTRTRRARQRRSRITPGRRRRSRRTLLGQLQACANGARRRGGVGLLNDEALAYDLVRDFRRLQSEARLPDEIVERFNALVAEFEAMVE